MQQLSSDHVTDAVLAASSALVAVAARSLAAVAEGVTLPQFRALVVLSERPRAMSELANELVCSPSAATRLCDRLVRKQLITRSPREESRREVEVAITAAGRELVADVLRRRRAEIRRIMVSVPPRKQAAMVEALNAFAAAAVMPGERRPSLRWDL